MDDKSLSRLLDQIRLSLADFSSFFSHIAKNKGVLTLPEPFVSFFSEINDVPWATYYESPELIRILPVVSALGTKKVNEISQQIVDLNSDQKRDFLSQLEENFLNNPNEFDKNLANLQSVDSQNLEAYLKTLQDEERQEELSFAYFFFTTFIVYMFQFLAVITHGRDMCTLVSDAKNGNDTAFCQAVRIDKTVLYSISYFRDRLNRAQLTGDRLLLSSLSTSIKGNVLGKQIKYPELWLVFSLLHIDGHLEKLSNEKLLDICEQLDIYQSFDINALSKRKNDFLKKQGSGFSN